MFFEILTLANLLEPSPLVYGENPLRSVAYQDSRFGDPSLEWIFVDMCMHGLKHPSGVGAHKMSSWIISTNPQLREHLQAKCDRSHDHVVLEGSYQGRNLTSWAEDYPPPFAKAVLRGMKAAGEVPLQFLAFPAAVAEDHPATELPSRLDRPITAILDSFQVGVYSRTDFNEAELFELETWSSLELKEFVVGRRIRPPSQP
jgi:hypothetical protein